MDKPPNHSSRAGAEPRARAQPHAGRGRARAIAGFGLGLVLALSHAGEAFAQNAIVVKVDARAPSGPLERVWSFFGYDEGNYTTVPLGQSLLTTIGQLNSGPSYIRSHFLLNTGDGVPSHKWGSTNVYTEDASGNPVYSWTLLDGIMDTIQATGNLPLAEIGFMPQALSAHPTPYKNSHVLTLDGGCYYPPKDYAKWAALIAEWAAHSKARYPDSLHDWLWELWNEPNISYWRGTPAEYMKLYDYTESALHGVLPDAKLGGPAVVGTPDWLRAFLDHCDTGTNAVTNQVGTRLDLVTFHAKGGVSLKNGQPEMDLGNQLRIHRDAFATIASFPKYKQTPIVISEADPDGCAACSNPENAYRNSPAYGAYVVSMMKRSLELEARLGVNLKGVLTWAFMFEDDSYFSVLRTLSTNGIDKPVLNAFKLLGALNGQRLPVTSSGAHPLDEVLAAGVRDTADVDAFATLSGSKVQVLVWNYHDDLINVPSAAVHLSIAVPNHFGTATVSELRADEAHGDAYTVWVKQGMPAAPSSEQRAELEQAMQPVLLSAPHAVPLNRGSIELDLDLPRFGISLFSIESTGESAGNAGDANAPGAAPGGAGCGCALPAHSRGAAGAAWLGTLGMLAIALRRTRRRLCRTGPAQRALRR